MKQCHPCGSAAQDETTVREPSKGNLSKNLPPGSFPVSDEKNHFEENRDLQIKSVLLTVGILLITAIFTCGILHYLQDNGYITQLHRNVMAVEKENSQWERDVSNTIRYVYSKYGFDY